jgi:hypothetical protein
MDKNTLKQYIDICNEINELSKNMTDTVSGSSPDYPYVQHTITISGVTLDMAKRKTQLIKIKAEIEVFILSLPNSKMRRIASMKVIEGLSWEGIAARMGPRYSVNSVRKIWDRIFLQK